MGTEGRSDRGKRGRRGDTGLTGRIISVFALVLGGFGFVVAPVVGDGLNSRPGPASPQVAITVPATQAQVAGAGIGGTAALASARKKQKKKKAKARRRGLKPIVMRSRITTKMVTTEESQGTYVGIRCPAGSKAISGGVLSQYISLLVSSSAPNHPISGKFTPRIWWVTVTNANVDGQGGALSWRGVVNCLTPVKLGKG